MQQNRASQGVTSRAKSSGISPLAPISSNFFLYWRLKDSISSIDGQPKLMEAKAEIDYTWNLVKRDSFNMK